MNIVKAIREKGIRTCVAIAFDRLVPQWLLRMRRFTVYEMDPRVTLAKSDQVAVSWSNSEDETQTVENSMGPQRSVVDIGADDMRVCIANVDDQLAGALWMASNVFMESGLGIRYELTEQQAWLFGAYVEKQYRRHGVYSGILDFILPSLEAKDKSQILLSVNPDNVASRIAHERYAKRKVGVVVAVRFLSVAMCTARGDVELNRRFTWNYRKKPIVIRYS